MLSARLFWICLGAAAAVPLQLPSLTPVLGTPPNCNMSSHSGLKQSGQTTGTGSVSTTGSTTGSVSGLCAFTGPNSGTQDTGAGNSGVSGSGVSAGNGIFGQTVDAGAGVGTAPDKTVVQTATGGSGGSAGTAGTVQKAGANVGAEKKKTVIVTLSDGTKVVKIVDTGKGTSTGSTGHDGSTTGFGTFHVQQNTTSVIKLKPPLQG
nr:CP19k-like protein 1 [Capitulum mitella]